MFRRQEAPLLVQIPPAQAKWVLQVQAEQALLAPVAPPVQAEPALLAQAPVPVQVQARVPAQVPALARVPAQVPALARVPAPVLACWAAPVPWECWELQGPGVVRVRGAAVHREPTALASYQR